MFTLDRVVPWGRSFDEYRRMFALTDDDLRLRIVGCGDGPASFNAEATRRGARVISCDPIYRYDAEQLRQRIADTYDEILDQARRNAAEFLWTSIPSVEALGELRMSAMNDFLVDYPTGKAEGRYIDAELPGLPFVDASFDLALCSHFLFLYSDEFPPAFHVESLVELMRVAGEVRVFPLLNMRGERSPHVAPVVEALRAAGLCADVVKVDYEFQRGGDEMLRVTRGG